MADANINHEDARAYWQSIDADVNGMLGGFPYISRVDLQGSKNFLAKLGVGGKNKGKIERAVDCGAGYVSGQVFLLSLFFNIFQSSLAHKDVYSWLETWKSTCYGYTARGFPMALKVAKS